MKRPTREQVLAGLVTKLPFSVYCVLMSMIQAYQPALKQMISDKGGEKSDLEPALDFDHDAIAEGLKMPAKEYLAALKELRRLKYIQRVKVPGVGPCFRIDFRKIEGAADA
jgi:hypothetical protein